MKFKSNTSILIYTAYNIQNNVFLKLWITIINKKSKKVIKKKCKNP